MMVVVPYIAGGLKTETRIAVDMSGLRASYVELVGDDGYYNLVASLWDDGDSFIIVEQDIVPYAGALRELASCPGGWCAFGYDYPPFSDCYVGMGCCKFSAGLVQRFPDALKVIGSWHDERHPPKHWCRIDGWLRLYLFKMNGVSAHFHGTVRHLHNGQPAHGCHKDK